MGHFGRRNGGRLKAALPLLRELLEQWHDYDGAIARVSAQIEEKIRPFEKAVQLLDTIPGVDQRGAQNLIAEIGVDMDQFPTHRHFAS